MPGSTPAARPATPRAARAQRPLGTADPGRRVWSTPTPAAWGQQLSLQRARHQHCGPCGPTGLCHLHSALPHPAKAAPGKVGVNGPAEHQ